MSIDQALRKEVEKWIAEDPDPRTASQLQNYLDSNNENELRSCFAGFLEFGTAGLRGPLGPGPSRMNRAVVTKTAAGIAAYMKRHGMKTVVIGRDARYGSEDFTRDTAEIMTGSGFTTYVLPRPLPTPVLAYAVKNLQCDVGIMVTASHNPPQDNGYKVYLGGTVDEVRYEGSQIISPTDDEISRDMAAVAPLPALQRAQGWKILDESNVDAYIRATSAIATKPGDLKVVYSAMHGVGTETLRKVFITAGFPEPILVTEQAEPDPDFPTVAFPNPEEPGAIDLALRKASEVSADLVIANDPDADRCAAAIVDRYGVWRMLRGDEVGALLGEYMARRAPNKEAILANSIVSSSILSKIAQHYGLRFAETLTGFKWLAKIPDLWFGYEEALGYAVDSHSVNDKDGISAALALVQLATDLHRQNQTLNDLLDEIWQRHGFHGTRQISVRTTSVAQIEEILSRFRDNTPNVIGRFLVTRFDDLEKPSDGLPPTNGVRIYLEDNIRVIVRPSGTEPKIKCYIEVISKERETSEAIIGELEKELRTFLS